MTRKINPLNGKITFINDDPNAPSPDLPVSDVLADMVESAVKTTNLSININSTTGGKHSKRSFHYYGMAVDINRVNGKRVDNPQNIHCVKDLQIFFSQHPDIDECFGPFINIRKKVGTVYQKTAMKAKHMDHLHITSQR